MELCLCKGRQHDENVFVWEIKRFPFRDFADETKWYKGEVVSELVTSIFYDGCYWVPSFSSSHTSSFYASVYVTNTRYRDDDEIAYRLCIEDDKRKEMWSTCVMKTGLDFDAGAKNAGTSLKTLIPEDLIRYMHIGFLERREKYFFKLVFYKDDVIQPEPRTSPEIESTDLLSGGKAGLMSGIDSETENKGFLFKCPETLGGNLAHLLDKDDDHDVTIMVKDKKLQAHRVILKARSPVFRSMFGRDTAERSSGLVQIEDCDPDVFADFIHYLYSGGVRLTAMNVANLYRISDKYQVMQLAKACADYMMNNFTVQSLSEYLSLAITHNEEKILERGIRFMTQHLREVLDSNEWKDFIVKNPLQSNEITSKALSFIL